MSHLPPEVVLTQVSQQQITNLIQNIESATEPEESKARYRRELYQMILQEPLKIHEETFHYLTQNTQQRISFIRLPLPYISTENPKPYLSKYRPRAILKFLKQYGQFIILKFFIKAVSKVIRIDHHVQACVAVDSLDKSPQPLQH